MTTQRAKTTARSRPSGSVAAPGARTAATLSIDALRTGVAMLGLTLDDSQLDKLQRFAALLLRWNRVHNLTALDEPGQVLSHHLLDSLAIVAPLRDVATHVAANVATHVAAPRVLDVGAGGGLPGIPLAIALPDWRFTLLDKVAKKTAFLTQAALELQLQNVTVATARVEEWDAPPFDLVIARAYASLGDLVNGTRALLAPTGRWCAMKGAVPTDEIAALDVLSPPVAVERTIKLRVPQLDAERHLIVVAPR